MPNLTARGAFPSSAIKAQYQKSLTDLVNEMYNSTIYWLRARYNARADELAPLPVPTLASDASPTRELDKELKDLMRQWSKRFNAYAKLRAKWFANCSNKSTTNQLKNNLKDAGFTVQFRNSRRVNNMLQAIVAENVNLIKSIPQQFLGEVNTIVMQSVQNGRDMHLIADAVENTYGKSRKRAIMIARDQTNKATEAISRARCEEIGVTHGFWFHRSGSKKPRETHEDMDGQRFLLSEGLYDESVGRKVKPGELVNCHCTFKLDVSNLGAGSSSNVVAMDNMPIRLKRRRIASGRAA